MSDGIERIRANLNHPHTDAGMFAQNCRIGPGRFDEFRQGSNTALTVPQLECLAKSLFGMVYDAQTDTLHGVKREAIPLGKVSPQVEFEPGPCTRKLTVEPVKRSIPKDALYWPKS